MSTHKNRLSRASIVEAALKLVDQEGLDGFSMRRLGTALGVEAMSLYNHFPNKAEIMDALHIHLLQQMPLPGALPGGDWRSQVRSSASAFRDLLRRHPKTIPLLASRAAVAPASLAYYEEGVKVFRRAGLSPLESVQAFQTIFAWVTGHGAFHFSRRGEEPEDAVALYRDYPALAVVAAEGPYDKDAEFELGLSLFLDGLERRLSGR